MSAPTPNQTAQANRDFRWCELSEARETHTLTPAEADELAALEAEFGRYPA